MDQYKIKLTDKELETWLAQFDGWRIEEGHLTKTWAIKPYFKATAFLNQIAWLAQIQNHHPDITLSWGRVEIKLISHDVGGLTTRDLRLAEAIENIEKDF